MTDDTEPDKDEPETEPEPDEEPDQPDKQPDAIDLASMDPDEVDIEDLENQEWTLGQGPTKELISFRGTVFLVEDPEDDDVLNLMAEAELGEGDTSTRMFKLCSSAISSPELTAEQWREMRMSERIGLTTRVSTAIGLNDMMDFPKDGETPQQGG